MKTLREVRDVTLLSACNCLREVSAGGAREVREVIAQGIDFIAGGEGQNAAGRALGTTYLSRPRLLERRAWIRPEGDCA